MPASDAVFAGSIPELYERLLVPLIFEGYATELTNRIVPLKPGRVLETAAGTGVVTRAMARALPADVELVATDLNPPMLARAEAIGTARPVRWEQADALALPYEDASFDVVVCQFGAMFFPDRVRGFAEARRVLRPGGALIFDVWDRIEENEFAHTVTDALAGLFPDDPPRFMARTPHGYFDRSMILADVAAAGFIGETVFETVSGVSRAASAIDAAVAYCQGTPFRNEIEQRSPGGLAEVTAVCAAELARRFGDGAVAGPIEGKIQAHIITARA